MSDTGGKIITTMYLLVVNFVLLVIFLMMAISSSNASKREYTYILIVYLMTFYILPYYILVNMWGLTKVFVVLMVFNLFGIIDKFQQKAAHARRISEFRARAKA